MRHSPSRAKENLFKKKYVQKNILIMTARYNC